MSLATFTPQAASTSASTISADEGRPASPIGLGSVAAQSPRGSFTLPGQLHYVGDMSGKSRRPHPLVPVSPDRLPAISERRSIPPHWRVLPVLFMEFLAVALTRAVLPHLLLERYGSNTYLVLGCADAVRGILAFGACPVFGKLSDQWGRKVCLFLTVFGTCAPVSTLALWTLWPAPHNNYAYLESSTTHSMGEAEIWSDTTTPVATEGSLRSYTDSSMRLPDMAIPLFVVLLGLSGMFSSTFTLVFAYISDTVKERDDRVAAYGLALATFGLSFTIGPMLGGYLASPASWPHDGAVVDHTYLVFRGSLVLTILDLLYIYFLLPESCQTRPNQSIHVWGDTTDDAASTKTSASTIIFRRQLNVDFSTPIESMRMMWDDPLLRQVGEVTLWYYTGLWAVISTLSVYAVQQFGLTPQSLGELMSALGLCTMIAEAILVRSLVPLWGEKKAIQYGLLSFAGQCVVLGAATESWHLFFCVGFSLLGNLVYPSLSSLVSSQVEPDRVGEALGAMNSIKALTEGIGPLVFGGLMTISGESYLPGWPYWIAALLIGWAYRAAEELPDDRRRPPGDEYVHELEFKRRRNSSLGKDDQYDDDLGCLQSRPAAARIPMRDDEDDEYQDLLPQNHAPLLSEVEESDDDYLAEKCNG